MNGGEGEKQSHFEAICNGEARFAINGFYKSRRFDVDPF